MIFAMSELYGVERMSAGSLVVKPIWLFTMMWIVPPVENACVWESCSVSAHDALPGDGRVAVDQDRQHELARRVAAPVLPRPHRAFDDGVHDLEVRGIERERHVHVAAAVVRGRTRSRGDT